MCYQVFVEYVDGSESDWKYAFDLDSLCSLICEILSGPCDVENLVIESYTK